MSLLFTPLEIRGRTFNNRIWVAPMSQYSAPEGIVGDWHLAHLGGFAIGRVGLVMTEGTAMMPTGRLTPLCPGLWNDEQEQAWKRITDFVHSQGTLIGVQLCHAGRKASVAPPAAGAGPIPPEHGGWQTVAPSAVAFDELPEPKVMTQVDLDEVTQAHIQAAHRAIAANFDVVEVHAAHGTLLHQFLSPLSNHRTDEFGGSLDNRMRYPLEVLTEVRKAWPQDRPMFVRISATDWVEGGWTLEESIVFSDHLRAAGIDLIDVSSGGSHPTAPIPDDVNYQIDLAQQLKAQSPGLTAAGGRITNSAQAEDVLASGKADAVFLGRQLLRDPHWPLRAAKELNFKIRWPNEYRLAARWE
jgi:2,4-dienoyl-CoA reductase-like NADH-dependent reductase (Old Yellow Enzyme family)